MKIAICAATLHRPAGLKRLLEGLNKLSINEGEVTLKIIIVDNDAHGGARAVCEQIKPDFRRQLEYHIEPERGIAPARNRALQAALQDDDLDGIAFIDDDESPAPDWIEQLLLIQREHNADVVTGPVLPRYDSPAPQWIEKGRFFHRKRHRTGQSLDYAYTNNVLFRASIVRKLSIHFDRRFTRIGSDDRHFFQSIKIAGYKIIWADEAVVYEWNPPSRTKASWLVRRQFHAGNGASLIEIDLKVNKWIRAMILGKGFYWILRGMMQTLAGIFMGRHVLVKGLQLAAFGFGRLYGFLGLRSSQYHRIHGK